MARFLYSTLFYLAQPLVWLRLLWRSRRQAAYRKHVGERYGFYRQRTCGPLIWLHAVSVGETRAAEPLIEGMLQRYPEYALLLTHMTPTGRDTGQVYVERHPGRVMQAYLPYDLPDAAARFLEHFRPALGLFMETEIWPNLIAAARRRDIPLALVNARLSEKSCRGYARFSAITRPALEALTLIAAQTREDADRFASLGVALPAVTGNLKFDVSPDPEMRAQGLCWRSVMGGRPVWLAASTRDGEEALVLDAFSRIRHPELLLVIVPRHPQRFDEVASLIKARGLNFARRSETGQGEGEGKVNQGKASSLPDLSHPTLQVWLGDSMGEMVSYYSACDVALIGGSLLPFGGQNLIEAAACGCPVLMGPHTFNFAQATRDALACGAARQVDHTDALVQALNELFTDASLRNEMKQKALAFSQAHQGATVRTLDLLDPWLAAARR